MSCCLGTFKYFHFVQTLYNIFSASTYQWKRLKKCLPKSGLVVKSLAQTQWCARAEAVKALFIGYAEIRAALTELFNDNTQSQTTP